MQLSVLSLFVLRGATTRLCVVLDEPDVKKPSAVAKLSIMPALLTFSVILL